MKKLILTLCLIPLFGCANGKFATGSASADATLTVASAGLADTLQSLADKVVQGQPINHTMLVQAGGDALRALENTGVQAVQPAVQEQIAKWVPKTPMWQDFAHGVGKAIADYTAKHGNNSAAINAALEAAAITLNNF